MKKPTDALKKPKLGRNQKIMVVSSVIVIVAGGTAVTLMSSANAKVFLDFLVDYSKWALGYVLCGSAFVKGVGLIRNGKKPEG
jgi:hypothetical protein